MMRETHCIDTYVSYPDGDTKLYALINILYEKHRDSYFQTSLWYARYMYILYKIILLYNHSHYVCLFSHNFDNEETKYI